MKRIAALFGGLAFVGVAMPAAAEFQIGAYGGWNGSFDSDVTFTGPGPGAGTDMTFHKVPWQGLSFVGDGGAPYYGVRGIWWLRANPAWGVMFDFTHTKVRADQNAVVSITGTQNGMPAPASDRIGNQFTLFEFTDGISLATINAVHRFPAWGRITPYAGAGVGINIPHVELQGPGTPLTFEYQFGGFSAEALVGVDVKINDRFSFFTEYQLSFSSVDVQPNGFDRLKTSIFTNQIAAGLLVRFGK